jgi:hypothetical protein
MRKVSTLSVALWIMFLFNVPAFAQRQKQDFRNHKIIISFGHTSKVQTAKHVTLKTTVPGIMIKNVKGKATEANDRMGLQSFLNYGAGDVDELISEITWQKPSAELLKVFDGAKMWRYLLEHGSSGQVQRLRQDPWNQPDAPLLTVELNQDGTEGFSFSLEQLLEKRAMWLPEQDIFLAIDDNAIPFDKHLSSLKGERVLHRVMNEPDATLAQFKSIWTDFGNPLLYDVPWQTKYEGTTGHLFVTAAAHGSVYKFAVDRWGKVRPDFASPHKFRMDPVWPGSRWTSQRIENGLPVIITSLENNGQFCEMEQFASPLEALDAAATGGSIPSVLFSRVRISGKPGPMDFMIDFTNEVNDGSIRLKQSDGTWTVVQKETGNVLMLLESENKLSVRMKEADSAGNGKEIVLSITGEITSGQVSEIVVKMPSPAIALSQLSKLKALNFLTAKHNVVSYWERWLADGARFEVPEKAVNELVRANLWHALILPRHTLTGNGELRMDLPYANTAYGQENSDWPVNQAVYVDYMIYGLRGYDQVAEDEYVSMFRTQQQGDGRIGGFANWGVYSAAQLYAIAQNYLLSGNDEQFERLLPIALKTLDWCLAQIAESNSRDHSTGLIVGPLNDLSVGEREWAFTQAYYVGGFELFARALSVMDHPRAGEVSRVSTKMKADVVREFARSSVRSSVVQLEDGTWINYVPTDATTPRRMLDEWYPTDVDTGPLHLTRLGVFDADGWLTTAMLNDHEDNLFFHNNGSANEPVYVQQANAYLMRDEPKAVIRSFYSFMASGFSHEQYSPLEHRWAHPQYYGPPSTDGAWFEIFRRMLINEVAEDTLMIGQAVPRAWLEKGKKIVITNAPTYFGDVSFSMEGESLSREIFATIELAARKTPKTLLVRFRHPDSKPIRSVVVNGNAWENFDAVKEYIIIPEPTEGKYVISAKY